MLKVGDRVKFLNAVGGGKITGFVTPKVVNVEDEEGFEVPCLITELIKDERFGEIPERPMVKAKKKVKEELPKPKRESQPLSDSIFAYPKKAVTEGFCIPDNIIAVPLGFSARVRHAASETESSVVSVMRSASIPKSEAEYCCCSYL